MNKILEEFGLIFILIFGIVVYSFPILIILKIWFNDIIITKLLLTDIVLILFCIIYIIVKD